MKSSLQDKGDGPKLSKQKRTGQLQKMVPDFEDFLHMKVAIAASWS